MPEHSRWSHVDWGHLALILIIATITIAYFVDSWHASSSVRNMVLILPVSVLSLTLCTTIAVSMFRRGGELREDTASILETEGKHAASTLVERIKPALLMAMFALYIFTLPWLGFDVGSAVFVVAALLLDGERRMLLILPLAIGFSLVATLLFRWLLPYPLPLLVL